MLPTVWMQATVVADPELRFTPGGKAVCNIRLVANDRKRQGDQWVDGDPFWVRATAWERLAENAADTLKKGDFVLIGGRLFTDEFERADGTKGTTVRMHAFDIGPSLRRYPAEPKRVDRAQPAPAGQAPTPGDVWASKQEEGGELAPPPM